MSLRYSLLLLILLASPAAQAAEAGAREKELRELRGRIEALQKSLAEAEETKSEAADALRESERAISETNRELRELGEQSRDINRRLAEIGADSSRGEEALKSQQALLARLLYQQYLGGQTEPLKLLLNREDPHDIQITKESPNYSPAIPAGCTASNRRRVPPVRSIIPTSWRCTTSARMPVCRTSSRSCSKGSRSARA